ncbi:beta-ketoacyl-ACP synthase III [Streptomyces sp. 7R007]
MGAMTPQGPRTAVLSGLGAFVPPRTVTNDDLSTELNTSDAWIISRTGVRERHVVDPGTATADLAAEAGARAMKSAGVTRVDCVVLATTTPDRPCPATAPEVAARLGAAGIPAFDLGAVCSGFVYGLAAAAGLISLGTAGTVLLIGADTFSTLLDPADRSTRVIFGDGAGAVVLRAGNASERGALGPVDLGSDGTLSELIMVAEGGSRSRSADPTSLRAGYFTMNGRSVFRTAVDRMTESSLTVLERAGWAPDDVHCLVAHQANLRIIDAVGERLGIPKNRRVTNIERVGNTAAASIPLALADAAGTSLQAGDRVLLTAFGGGATWGSAALVWPEVVVH